MRALISVLPNELILLVVENLIIAAGDSRRAIVTSLTTITSICSHWRKVVVQHGPFWANIYIKLSRPPKSWRRNNPKLPTRLIATDTDRVRCFLERSKQAPIRIFIPRSWTNLSLLSEDDRLAVEADWELVNSLLDPHMERCLSIFVSFRGIGGAPEIAQLLEPWKFPLLQELTMENCDPRMLQNNLTSWENLWGLSPQCTPLRSLKFSDPRRYLPRAIDASWPMLERIELEVDGQFWPNVCETLTQLPSFRELRISLCITPSMDAIPPTLRQPRIHLPFVKHVTTSNLAIWHDICTPSLHCVTFTSLQFYISPQSTNSIENDPAITRLLQSLTEMPLRSVTFSARSMDDNVVFRMLERFPRVKNLHFHESYGHGRLLNTLSRALEQRSTASAPESQSITNIDAFQTSSSETLKLPLLRKICIEESQTRYLIFTDFPNIWPEPPHSFVYRERRPTTAESPKRRIFCDQCRPSMVCPLFIGPFSVWALTVFLCVFFKLRCDASSNLGRNCTACTKRARNCSFDTNTAVMEARETEKARARLQALGLEVTWFLK
ncbi:hypothetical protein DL93DRAFT_2164331 [Clavulina sp. PMI_390]|nr:hypothetical protein DL93DRAFT_2164331 [Clavulina sp. PMI_390]